MSLSKLNATTGNRTVYLEVSYNIVGDVSSISLDSSGSKLYMVGNIAYFTDLPLVYWDTTSTNVPYQNYLPLSGTSMTCFHTHKGLTDMFMSISKSFSSLVFVMHNFTTSTPTVEWNTAYNCSTVCPNIVSGISDTDSNNIYTAISSSDSNVVYMALSLADGSVVTNFRQTDTSTTLTAGSLFVDSNSLVWIGMHATDYSELISYNTSSSTYTKYQLTGYQYMHQYVDPSNSDAWYALRSTQYADYARISNFDEVSGLNVTTGTTGFDDNTSIFGSPISFNPRAYNPTDLAATTSASSEEDLNYNVSFACFPNDTVTTSNNTVTNNTATNGTTGDNTGSDDLSAGEIVGKH